MSFTFTMQSSIYKHKNKILNRILWHVYKCFFWRSNANSNIMIISNKNKLIYTINNWSDQPIRRKLTFLPNWCATSCWYTDGYSSSSIGYHLVGHTVGHLGSMATWKSLRKIDQGYNDPKRCHKSSKCSYGDWNDVLFGKNWFLP